MAVAVEIGDGREGAVDGQVFGVDADAVPACVVVGEESRLEDGVVGGFPAGNEVGRAEVGLFDFVEVVLRVGLV